MPESTKTDHNKLTLHNQTMQLEEEKHISVGCISLFSSFVTVTLFFFFFLIIVKTFEEKARLGFFFFLSSEKKSTEIVQIMRKEQMNLINDLQVSIIFPSTTSHLDSISALPDLTPEAH